MAENDLLQRFIFETVPIRGEFIHLQNSFQTIIKQHSYPPPLRKLLGEALCVAGLLSAIIKFNGRLTIQFRGGGKLKLLLAQCDNDFHLRGLAKWEGNLSYEEFLDSFKHGVLVVMLDSNPSQPFNPARYQGVVKWRGNSLAESIEGYFKDSEQLDTKIWLNVNESSAAGFLLQVIPASDKGLNDLEKDEVCSNWKRILDLTSNLACKDLLNLGYEALLHKLYPQEDIRIFHGVPMTFRCSCNRKRGEDAILLLGRREAEEELNNSQTIVVTCDFCNKEYIFQRADIAQIFEKNGNPPSSIH